MENEEIHDDVREVMKLLEENKIVLAWNKLNLMTIKNYD